MLPGEPIWTDQDRANKYRAMLEEAYQPVADLMDQAAKEGFEISFKSGQVAGRQQLIEINVSRKL